RGAGSGFAVGAAGSGSAAGTVTDGTGSLALAATAGVTKVVCVGGVEVLPGRTANSVQPLASPTITAARPRKIGRKFDRSIGLSFPRAGERARKCGRPRLRRDVWRTSRVSPVPQGTLEENRFTPGRRLYHPTATPR